MLLDISNKLAKMLRSRLLLMHAVVLVVTAQQPPLPGYEPIAELSDEFDGTALDPAKWSTDPSIVLWPGRAPGLFEPSNVRVSNGTLQLWAQPATRNASWPAGYDNYTTAAVRSLAYVQNGYFEIRWRSGSSGISSSWWFHDNNGTTWTEIDVFETTGTTNRPGPDDAGDPDRCRNTPLTHCRTGCPANRSGTCGPQMRPFAPTGPSCNLCPCNVHNTSCDTGGAKATDLPSHVHVFKLPGVAVPDLPARCGGCTEHAAGAAPCSKPGYYEAPAPWSAAFHTASLNWTTDERTGLSTVAVGADGRVVSVITSPCLVQPLRMDFDRETMPGWMALPDPVTLPDQPFEVDYVRAWRKL